jgi:hypothetical protein
MEEQEEWVIIQGRGKRALEAAIGEFQKRTLLAGEDQVASPPDYATWSRNDLLNERDVQQVLRKIAETSETFGGLHLVCKALLEKESEVEEEEANEDGDDFMQHLLQENVTIDQIHTKQVSLSKSMCRNLPTNERIIMPMTAQSLMFFKKTISTHKQMVGGRV